MTYVAPELILIGSASDFVLTKVDNASEVIDITHSGDASSEAEW